MAGVCRGVEEQGRAGMTSGAFDAGGWIERLVVALRALAKAQERYLHVYWQHHPREPLIVDGRDETPFSDGRPAGPSIGEARYSRRFDREAEYAPLLALLDSTRHALLAHPTLESVWR